MKVFVLLVQDGGYIAEHSVHSSRDKAWTYLAAYCRGQWEDQGHEGPLSRSDDEAIKQYFDYWDTEMTVEIDEAELDPSPAAVDQSPEFEALPVDQEFFGDES